MSKDKTLKHGAIKKHRQVVQDKAPESKPFIEHPLQELNEHDEWLQKELDAGNRPDLFLWGADGIRYMRCPYKLQPQKYDPRDMPWCAHVEHDPDWKVLWDKMMNHVYLNHLPDIEAVAIDPIDIESDVVGASINEGYGDA